MLTIEQYQNLSNHIKYAHMKLDSIMTKKCVVNDAEVTDLITGVAETSKKNTGYSGFFSGDDNYQ